MSSRTGQSKDANNTLAFNDSIANALTVIDPIHRRVHLAEYWYFCDIDTSVASSGVLNIRVNYTGTIPIHARITTAHGGTSDARFELYEGSTYTVAGTTNNPLNYNRAASPALPGPVFFTGATWSGTSDRKLEDAVVGPTVNHVTNEWVFDPTRHTNKNWEIRLTNLAAGAVPLSLRIDFYMES